MSNVIPKLGTTPGRISHAGPGLGEHNEEIFPGELGLDDARYRELEARGVI